MMIYMRFAKALYAIKNKTVSYLNRHKEGKRILIYSDIGVSPYSSLGLFIRLKNLLRKSSYRLELVDSDYIKNKPWEIETELFIMPGGRARPYYNSLGAEWKIKEVPKGEMRVLHEIGIGNQRIRDFVMRDGGKFLGVCAGAYYATGISVFEKGGDLEVIDEGPLKFFSGIAEGPAYGLGQFSYRNKSGARLAEIVWEESERDKEKAGSVYYNGGCFFHKNKQTDYKVLARYNDIPDKPAAVIACRLNKGLAVLSGVHFETSHLFFPVLSKKYSFFHRGLKNQETFQIDSLSRILDCLDIQIGNDDTREKLIR